MLKASRRLLACALSIGALYAVAGPAGTPVAAPDARAAIVGDCTPLSNWGTPRQDLVQAVLNLVNQNRAASGLGPLKLSPTLTNAALWKSRHMAYFQYMQHDDPAPPVARTWYDRVLTCGYSPNAGAGENIAYGYQTPDAVMNAWMNSAGHRANILNASYRAIGIGVAASASGLLYWTQDFGTVDDSGSTTPPTTPPPPSTRSATTPATFTSIFTGTAVGGSAASLSAADGSTYQVASSGGTTSWYGRMDAVPKSVKTLTVTYTGSNSAACNQTVYAYNWTAAAWSVVDSRSVGSTGAVITASLSGTLGNFVSGSTTGSVAIAIVCSGAATPFTARADLLQASYTY
jgi:uncharacterized protein YkwD